MIIIAPIDMFLLLSVGFRMNKMECGDSSQLIYNVSLDKRGGKKKQNKKRKGSLVFP